MDDNLDRIIDDPLLHCLTYIARMKGIQATPDSIKSSIPMTSPKFNSAAFVNAAEKMNLSAKYHKRRLKDLTNLLLPAVLILKDEKACVLLHTDRSKGVATVVFPDIGDGSEEVTLDKLREEFSGHVLLVKANYKYESRSDEKNKFKPSKSWFWGTLFKFKHLYFRVLIASIFINLFVLATPLFIMNVYDRVVPNQAVETLWVLSTGIFIVLSFDIILKTLRSYFIDVVGKKADLIMSSALLEHSLGIKMDSQMDSPAVRANHLNSFESVRDFVGSATVTTFVDLPFIMIFIVVMSIIGGSLYIPSMVAVVTVMVIALVLSIPLFEAVKETFAGSSQKTALLVESIRGAETVKSHTAQGVVLGKWQKFSAMVANAAVKSRFFSSLAIYLTQFCIALSTIIVVILGVYLIRAGTITTGALIACVILNSRALAPLAQLTQLMVRYQQTKCAYEALDDIMETPIDNPADKSYVVIGKCDGEIIFDHVNFKYKGQTSDLFHDISLQIKPGEHVAIIGNMGSGKSTFLKLINGLYQPKEGALRLDGIDLRQLNPSDLHRQIGYLDQNPTLFFGTARENISLKAPWVEDSVILKAAELSGVSRFLGAHAEGYQYQIGESGKGLSEGQIQTIALARAYLMDPKILLLDEPTASMDSSTEQQFMQTIKAYGKEKTTIIVTHKPSIIQLVDRIILLHQGKVLMDGPREQVLAELNKKVAEKKGSLQT